MSQRRNVPSFTSSPIPHVRIAVVGLGQRGVAAMERLQTIEGASVVAVADVDEVRMQEVVSTYADVVAVRLASTPDSFHQALSSVTFELVYICTPWQSHAPLAIAAMEAGCHVAVEVPATLTMEELCDMVRTAEKTHRHCMMLENCCYDPCLPVMKEMIVQGLLGDLVHADGEYLHQLGERWTPWRLELNRELSGDIYPTHAFGPICWLLGIGDTTSDTDHDELETLVAMDSCAVNGPAVYEQMMGQPGREFRNGDQTTTLIRTRKGRTITLQHNVLTPRPYSRMFRIVGSKGMVEVSDAGMNIWPEALREKVAQLQATVKSSSCQWPQDVPSQFQGHDSMSWVMDWRLIQCLRHGEPLDISIRDMALWCSVGPLSRQSIEQGSVPVRFPAFS